MIDVKAKSKCCGCTACASVCPSSAISMKCDGEGFAYPVVLVDKCVNCGLCDRVCAFTGKNNSAKREMASFEVYAAKHISKEVLKESTSGGMFTALSDAVFANGGTVYGAAFDEQFVVRHIRADNSEARNKMRGSKYVQSDMGVNFSAVKQDLADGKMVLFTGTPCQTDGLRSFFRGKTDNLICCDLVCNGTTSPLIWSEHVIFISKKKHSKLKSYKFRPKNWSWHVHNELAVFENGNNHRSCLYLDLYYSKLIMRPSCHDCPYKNLNRPSDITIADCRGIDNILRDFGSDEGVSLVIVNTPQGKVLFDQVCEQLTYEKINITDVMQPPLQHSSVPNANRALFWDTYHKNGYKKAIDVHFGRLYNLKYNIKQFLK